MKQHALDISKTGIASLVATLSDGLVFALLVHLSLVESSWSTGLFAFLAAGVGGVIHYSLCSFWVFERFESNHLRAASLYVLVSGMAALLHGFLTQILVIWFVSGVAWGISKVVLFLCWTYPLSRYAVFGQRDQT